MLPWKQADLMFKDDSTSNKHRPGGDDTPIYGPVHASCQGTQGTICQKVILVKVDNNNTFPT